MERRTVLKLLGTSALGLCRPVLAQGEYPTHTIKMIVASTPGSATDLAGRFAAQIFNKKYGQTVLVENKPGAGGIIGMLMVAAAAPDGYTLQTGGLGHNVIPPVIRTGIPIDIPKAIMPIAQIAEFVNVLLVRANHPANSLDELLAYERSKAAKLNFGSNGIGSSSHMTGELFAIRTKLKLQHIPYKAASDALIGVVNGDLDLCFMNMPPALPMVQSGKLKALAVTSSYRARQLPKVPTMEEQGMKDFDVTSWLGLYGPAGIPSKIVDKLSRDLLEGLAKPEYQKKIIGAGFEPKLRDVKEFTAYNNAELKRWASVAKTANISVPYANS